MAGPIAALFASLPSGVQAKVERTAAADTEAGSQVSGRVCLSGTTRLATGIK